MRILPVSELPNPTSLLREVRVCRKIFKNIIKAVGIAKILFLLCGL